MAVVTKYGTGYKAPTALSAIEGVFRAARMNKINSLISIANGDSLLSLYYVGSVPSNGVPDPSSAYYYEAVTGVSDFDIGYYYPNGGAVIDADALVDGDDISSAGSQTLAGHGTLTVANMGKRHWELAGLTADPGGELDIVAQIKATSSAAKQVRFEFSTSKGG